MRAATASACFFPSSDRCRPLARPGRSLPVVGVCPCRTRRTSVGLGRRRGGIEDRFATYPPSMDSLGRVTEEIIDCFRCPRLVAWREQIAVGKRAAFRDGEYGGRPVPSFGAPRASLLVVGLAPAAHGGNRTGR